MRDLRELNQYRDRESEAIRYGAMGEDHTSWAGIFRIPVRGQRQPLLVIASTGDGEDLKWPAWDHVSVSLRHRCPTWEEMALVKGLFFHPHEAAMQLHPAEGENISNHPYCLHIWRPVREEIPLPPSIFVGHKALGQRVEPLRLA